MSIVGTIFLLLSTSLLAHGFSPLPRWSTMRKGTASSLQMSNIDAFDALLFDCDGVIAETERDVHRISFNEAFKAKGLSDEWSVEKYGELLRIGGGKERMTGYFNEVGWPTSVPEAERKDFIKELHLMKTENFNKVVESGKCQLRPGVMRLMDEALNAGIFVAVCSTSNEKAVTTIVRTLLGDRLGKIKIYAGDIVANKKPAPDVYLLAAKELGVEPERCWVIEDSEIGCKAGKAAGMKVVVTKSIYTENENFEGAEAIIKDLDNGLDGPITATYLNYKSSDRAYKAVKATENADLFGATPDMNNMVKKMLSGDMGKGMKM